MKLHFNPVRLFRSRLRGTVQRPHFDYTEIVRGKTWACTDLDAFPRPLPRLKGIEGVVIMEDRFPDFYMSFRHFSPWAQTTLNRHGPLHEWETHQDLRGLVQELHEQKIKVAIGFWNYGGWLPRLFTKSKWLRDHPELKRLPSSSDLYPFLRLQKEDIEYSDYIAHQYQKLQDTFGFDGLMLADACGFSTIRDPDKYRDKEESIPQWTRFYETIAKTVHRTKGLLLAYDCRGLSFSEARRHGADYRELARAGLDILVYQAYPQAWGEYWMSSYREQFDLDACVINLRSVKKGVAGSDTKVLYSLELGDSVEGWWPDPEKTRKQIEKLDPLADGRFLVWANDLFAGLVKE